MQVENSSEACGDDDPVGQWQAMAHKDFRVGDNPDAWRDWQDDGQAEAQLAASTDPVLAMQFKTIHMATARRQHRAYRH